MLVLTNVQTMNGLDADADASQFRSLTGVTFAYVLVLVLVSAVQYTFVHWFYWLGVSTCSSCNGVAVQRLAPLSFLSCVHACVCAVQGLHSPSVRPPSS